MIRRARDFAGFYLSVPRAPFLPGFEIAGVVTEIGAGVDGFKPGDLVAAITLGGGGYATHAVIPAATAIPLPRELDPALGVAILVQGLTARLLLEEARVKAGDTVLVSAAAGGVGCISVQIAKAMNVKSLVLPPHRSWTLCGPSGPSMCLTTTSRVGHQRP